MQQGRCSQQERKKKKFVAVECGWGLASIEGQEREGGAGLRASGSGRDSHTKRAGMYGVSTQRMLMANYNQCE